MQLKTIRHNFFLRFLGIAGVSLLFWKPFSFLYLHIIAPVTNGVLSLFSGSAHLQIIDGILKFQYGSITPQLLQFSVRDVDQIYLNIIVFFALVFSSWKIPLKYRMKFCFSGLGVLILVHIGILSMYTYTTIWDYVSSQPEAVRASLMDTTDAHFPESLTGIFRRILYLWNSWGWDVIPLLLWLPIGFKQFTPLPKLKPAANQA